jgi:glycerol-3-phosphate acyltransferase PlsY
MLLAHKPFSWIAFWSAIAMLIVLRHIPNIKRLLSGTETKIGQNVNLERDQP